MEIHVSNLCYAHNYKSKQYALDAAKEIISLHVGCNKMVYIPVPDKGKKVKRGYMNCQYNIDWDGDTHVVFVSVNNLNPAMRFAFENWENAPAHRIIARLNGTVYDYATSVVKELLLDEDIHIVKTAVDIASEYRLYSMSAMPLECRHYMSVMKTQCCTHEDIRTCGKLLSESIL